ncbi:UDP pyrophosphate phosphatase [Paenibacillus sp. CAA11]|uniref:undecaprenyl-diphosphate phosphatase n=1 Tax=Paenibacillus sp. CAA11 TaxID=1532905 RepID=UPI000D34C557|nr:undecaprenyl-diphosphate phosphatase [Paenibacillus sp. CAA11]AWB45119.1 UDP pyrophosphate phosphatase [Paenibacillus sp. CAA11]
MDVWELLKYFVLGVVQGFTEPIPVSSSGHLIIVERLFGLHIEGLSFEVLVNTASLLAIIFIYRHDLIKLIVSFFRYIFKRSEEDKADFKLGIYLIIATIPAGLLGALFSDVIGDVFKGMTTIGIALLITGVALWIVRNLRGRKSDKDLSFRDTLLVGLAQAVALIPGISRSGSTIVTSLLLGWKQETALKFSFFLYIPVSVGGMILEGKDLLNDPDLGTLMLPYAAAFIATLFTTYFSMKWFMGIMAKGNLKVLSLYCFVVGAFVLIFL